MPYGIHVRSFLQSWAVVSHELMRLARWTMGVTDPLLGPQTVRRLLTQALIGFLGWVHPVHTIEVVCYVV